MKKILINFEPSDLIAFSALIVSIVAVGLNIESRLQQKPNLSIKYDDTIVGYFSELPPDEFAPETLVTRMDIINSGGRGITITDINLEARVINETLNLLNASETIYKSMKLPIDIPSDSSKQLEIAWILGGIGKLEKYNHRFSQLPHDIIYKLEVRNSVGDIYSKTYFYHDIVIIDLKEANEYRDALSTPQP